MNIQDYINGSKKGKSAKEFEKAAMRDPFLAEALEGYESVKGNHHYVIAGLRQKISRKSKKRRKQKPLFFWTTIVAVIIVLGIIVVFFLGRFHLLLDKKAAIETEITTQPSIDTAKTATPVSVQPVAADSVKPASDRRK